MHYRQATATLVIRNAPRLTQLQALKLARLIAIKKRTGKTRCGVGKAELRVKRGTHPKVLADWLECQGVKMVHAKAEYASIYTAKLYPLQ
jgi:hypothetical protein